MTRTKSIQYLDGWQAHKDGVSVDDNPYSETAQRVSNRLWTSGWCQRFSCIKHGSELEFDEWYDE